MSVKTAQQSTTARKSTKWVNEEMIGSGYQNDGSPFINITWDRDVDKAQVAAELAKGKALSLQPIKNINPKFPARKYVLVLRAPQQ